MFKKLSLICAMCLITSNTIAKSPIASKEPLSNNLSISYSEQKLPASPDKLFFTNGVLDGLRANFSLLPPNKKKGSYLTSVKYLNISGKVPVVLIRAESTKPKGASVHIMKLQGNSLADLICESFSPLDIPISITSGACSDAIKKHLELTITPEDEALAVDTIPE